MGMGEPLLNYKNVLKAIERIMIVATGGQGEARAALGRIAFGNHEIKLAPGDTVITATAPNAVSGTASLHVDAFVPPPFPDIRFRPERLRP